MTTAKPVAPVARDADAELEALFAAINDVILVLDAEGRYVKIAPTNPSLLYRPAAELLGKTLRQVFDGPQAEQFMEYIRTALATRTTVHFEYSLSIEGREVWFSGAISPMTSDQVVLGGRAAARERAAVPRAGRALERRRHAARAGRDGALRQPVHAAGTRLRRDRKRGRERLRARAPRRPYPGPGAVRRAHAAARPPRQNGAARAAQGRELAPPRRGRREPPGRPGHRRDRRELPRHHRAPA